MAEAMKCDHCRKVIPEGERHIVHEINAGLEIIYFHYDKKCAPSMWWDMIDDANERAKKK